MLWEWWCYCDSTNYDTSQGHDRPKIRIPLRNTYNQDFCIQSRISSPLPYVDPGGWHPAPQLNPGPYGTGRVPEATGRRPTEPLTQGGTGPLSRYLSSAFLSVPSGWSIVCLITAVRATNSVRPRMFTLYLIFLHMVHELCAFVTWQSLHYLW